MRFSFVPAVVMVIALACGTESLVKRETKAHLEVDSLIKYIQDITFLMTKTTRRLVDVAQTHELTDKANVYIEEGRTQPLAQQIQEELKPLAASIKDQLKPMTESMQAQLKPFKDQVQPQLENIWKTLLDAAKTPTN